jgi:hypothetical protein
MALFFIRDRDTNLNQRHMHVERTI